MARVRIVLGGKLNKLRKLAAGDPTLMQSVLRQWSKIYSAFVRRRFDRASKGGADWAALALSTIRNRRKGKKVDKKRSSLARDTKNNGRLVSAGGTFSILRDTGLLFSTLDPSIEILGPVQKVGGIYKATAVFGGAKKYPDGLTTQDVLSFHQEGGPHLPQRKILVDPDDRTKRQMESSGKRMLKDYLDG